MGNSIQDEFISTVSHEMRTPLTSIRGFSQTLLSSWDKLDEENKKKFIKIIEEQSGRLINLVENILTVSKINADKPILKSVDVNSVIEKVIQLISIKDKTHKIIKNFSKNLPTANLDEDKFQQIMTNLIDNAEKYSPADSEVTISTALKNEKIEICVQDNGVGIKEEDISKIFEKFVRLENHLTSTTQGNGLGLYITKSLVELMNGQIFVESELNKGTKFKVTFPVYNQEEALKCSLRS